MKGELHAWPLPQWWGITPAALENMLHAVEPRERQRSAVTYFDWVIAAGGRVWIGVVGGEPAGYLTLLPMPGLPQMGELRGGLLPAWRGQGLGTAWLPHIKQAAGGWTFQVLVQHLDDPLARFLKRHGFEVDHEEILLTRDLRRPLPSLTVGSSTTLRTLPRRRAGSIFVALYDASFGPHPWYQPYTVSEVLGTLKKRHTLYFLFEQETPIGFVWARRRGKQAELEPLGVVSSHQGQGMGRRMMVHVLHALRDAGATSARLAVWSSNRPARRMYQRLDFVERRRRYYLRWPPPGRAGSDEAPDPGNG